MSFSKTDNSVTQIDYTEDFGLRTSEYVKLEYMDSPLMPIMGNYFESTSNGGWHIRFEPKDDHSVIIHGIIHGIIPTHNNIDYSVTGTVSNDHSRIAVNLAYKLADQYNGEDLYLWGYDGSYIYPDCSLIFNKTKDGFRLDGTIGIAAITETNGYYKAAWASFDIMPPIVLTKTR